MANAYNAQVEKILDKYVGKMSNLATFVPTDKAFKFEQILPKVQVDAIFNEMHEELLKYILQGVQIEWELSNVKYDKIAESYLRGITFEELSKTKKKQLERFRKAILDRNKKSLKAFASRKKYGKTLSNRVWGTVKDFKGNMEVAMQDLIKTGITDGTSAAEMATNLKKYLKEPNRLYRRVQKDGKLVPSKAAKMYNPGRGVYRSSYKNALRLARTEINQAYRFADYTRIQNLDFVVGIRIKRSHQKYDCDICEALKGDYPKDYVFLGHHVSCRCVVETILADRDEMKSYLQSMLDGSKEPLVSKHEVKDYPEAFKKFAKNYKKKEKEFNKFI